MMWDDDLQLAMQLADLADQISLSYFRSSHLIVDKKSDDSDVSLADREVEIALRKHLASARPHDAIVGEEFGAGDVISTRRWVLDPIDGTTRYLRGIPLFASLIALEQDGDSVLGVASAPALKRRWWAARGLGAFVDGRPIRVSAISKLGEAHLSLGNPGNWLPGGQFKRLGLLSDRAGSTTGYGDFWPHMLVAEGAAEAAIEPSAALWDLAPLKVIVEEAGGRFTDFTGVSTAAGQSAISSNSIVHDELVQLLKDDLDNSSYN
ncbi:MAG TPA: inositol monophosphatase family protein [Pyrinomonadaceae bacterium]|nr:inositol monophosphatase family protein [Pyrinomonadaceae bacterium]